MLRQAAAALEKAGLEGEVMLQALDALIEAVHAEPTAELAPEALPVATMPDCPLQAVPESTEASVGETFQGFEATNISSVAAAREVFIGPLERSVTDGFSGPADACDGSLGSLNRGLASLTLRSSLDRAQLEQTRGTGEAGSQARLSDALELDQRLGNGIQSVGGSMHRSTRRSRLPAGASDWASGWVFPAQEAAGQAAVVTGDAGACAPVDTAGDVSSSAAAGASVATGAVDVTAEAAREAQAALGGFSDDAAAATTLENSRLASAEASHSKHPCEHAGASGAGCAVSRGAEGSAADTPPASGCTSGKNSRCDSGAVDTDEAQFLLQTLDEAGVQEGRVGTASDCFDGATGSHTGRQVAAAKRPKHDIPAVARVQLPFEVQEEYDHDTWNVLEGSVRAGGEGPDSMKPSVMRDRRGKGSRRTQDDGAPVGCDCGWHTIASRNPELPGSAIRERIA
jgi:hypothetical protein